jgi:phosphonate ABC transporter permease subunit PhnE
VNNNTSSRGALQRLLIVLAIVVGVLIYAYGWRVTDISLEETQDPIRQESVTRALQELLSPDIFDQDRESEFVSVNVAYECPEDGAPIEQPAVEDGALRVEIEPACGGAGDVIRVEGFNFVPDADAFLRWLPPDGQPRPLVRIDIDDVGHFSTQFEVPRLRGASGEIHELQVEGSWPTGLPYPSETTYTVLEKIIETIFLALMATTIAVPIAAVLSFLAARNLMRQVSLPLGNVLVGLILLPVGWLLGANLLGPLGQLGVSWGRDLIGGLIAGVIAIGLYVLAARFAGEQELRINSAGYYLRKTLLQVLLLVVMIVVLGVLGGVGIWLGEIMQEGFLSDLGNFVGTLGTLVDLLIGLVAGVGGAFLVATLGMELTRDWLKYLPASASNPAGAVLGAVGGAILMLACGLIADLAALLMLLPPIVAAVLGMQIVAMLFNRATGTDRLPADSQPTTVRMILGGVGAVVVFAAAYIYLDTSRGLVDRRLPSNIEWTVLGLTVQGYLVKCAIVGAALGGIGGLLAGTRATFPLGMTIYNTTRTVLNALRAIEPLIMGIVFVIWVGVGPFAGVLALTLHSIAALGKLYSEQTENIDAGPMEAMQATGATRLQTIIYGVVPQIVPPYIAFTMYRWDINVRMSTIIGFVGGGGIGFLLQQQINLLRYQDAGVAVLAIAIVVSVLDYASASIRERIV